MIPVTKPYLPDIQKYKSYVDRIYQSGHLTNNGPLVRELKNRLEEYLGVENLLLVANGTLGLQVAYKALGISDEAITTPFSFVATASSLLWEGIKPVYVDIENNKLGMDSSLIEAAISDKTTGIVPVHVFGNSCNVEKIDAIAEKYGLKVVYDAAHAFGVQHNGQSILKFGDASVLSFHATKVFHTIEGGAVVFKDREIYEKARKMVQFGYDDPENIEMLGINAKMNEFQAAMGLCVLDSMSEITEKRNHIYLKYKKELNNSNFTVVDSENSSYFPVLVQSEEKLKHIISVLKQSDILARRYFYPSLDAVDKLNIPEQDLQHCRISRDISYRILCLPLYPALEAKEQEEIITLLNGI